MKRYQAVLFDLDGTLIDTSSGVLDCIKLTVEALHLGALSDEDMLRFIGPPLQDSFKEVCHLDGSDIDLAVKTFRTYYTGDNLYNVSIYDGIFQLLDYLKANGTKVAVATYKQEAFAKNLLEHVGIAKYCDYVYGSDPEGVLTKADIVQKCIDSFDVDRSEVVLIGDSHFDAIGAEHAGVDFIGVTYGFGFHSESDVESFPSVLAADSVFEVLEAFEATE